MIVQSSCERTEEESLGGEEEKEEKTMIMVMRKERGDKRRDGKRSIDKDTREG